MKKTAFAALFGLALTAATSAHADDKLKLILDWYVNPDHGPIIVAEKLGYFKDAGLDVEIVAPADASTPTKMVAAGQADLAVSYQQQVHLQVHEGLPLVRVGTLIDSPLNCLMARDDGSVNSIADLKGKKIGYSVAGVEETLLGTILGQHGVKLSDVELINVNFACAVADVEAGRRGDGSLSQCRTEPDGCRRRAGQMLLRRGRRRAGL